MTRTLRERWTEKVSRGKGCWLWRGAQYPSGYGAVSVRVAYGVFRATGAHRVAWELFRGPIPRGMHVLHKCDVRNCVRPAHLFLGTNDDNIRDMHRKGRQSGGSSPGVKNTQAKLTDSDVRRIRRLRARGATLTAIAARYGVHHSLVWLVTSGNAWTHVS